MKQSTLEKIIIGMIGVLVVPSVTLAVETFTMETRFVSVTCENGKRR